MTLTALIFIIGLAGVLWYTVLYEIVPRLHDQADRDLLAQAVDEVNDLRPTATEVAAAEAELPEVRDGWHLEPAHLTRPGDTP